MLNVEKRSQHYKNERQNMTKKLKMIEMELSKIKPYPSNAKKHNLEWIKKSIAKFNPDQPIVIDAGNVIIKGHGRYEAAKALGMKTFPVIIRDDMTPDEVRLSRIADNRSGEAGWNIELLAAEIDFIKELDLDFDLSELGMGDDWLEGLASANTEDKSSSGFDKGINELKEGLLVEIKCNNETDQQELYERLTQEGYECRVLTL